MSLAAPPGTYYPLLGRNAPAGFVYHRSYGVASASRDSRSPLRHAGTRCLCRQKVSTAPKVAAVQRGPPRWAGTFVLGTAKKRPRTPRPSLIPVVTDLARLSRDHAPGLRRGWFMIRPLPEWDNSVGSTCQRRSGRSRPGISGSDRPRAGRRSASDDLGAVLGRVGFLASPAALAGGIDCAN